MDRGMTSWSCYAGMRDSTFSPIFKEGGPKKSRNSTIELLKAGIVEREQ